MSSNKDIQDSVLFTIPFHSNCTDYVQYTKNIRQIELETHTDIQLLQIVRISGNIKNIKKANQRVSGLKVILAQNDYQDNLKKEVHILQSKIEEMENRYEQKFQELDLIKKDVFQAEMSNVLAEMSNVHSEMSNVKEEIQEMKNTFDQKILELDLIKKDVFHAEISSVHSEMSNVKAEIQDIKNTFDQKILELTNARTNNKFENEATNTIVQENIENEDIISDMELKNFFESTQYIGHIRIRGEKRLHIACEIGRLDVVKKLIQNEIDIKNYANLTPLIIASRNGHKAIVKYLISKKADVNIRTIHNQTALSLARKYKNYEIVKILENHGATT